MALLRSFENVALKFYQELSPNYSNLTAVECEHLLWNLQRRNERLIDDQIG